MVKNEDLPKGTAAFYRKLLNFNIGINLFISNSKFLTLRPILLDFLKSPSLNGQHHAHGICHCRVSLLIGFLNQASFEEI